MTSMITDPKDELKEKLFLPNHCPDAWRWAKFHTEGEIIFFSTKDDVISFGHNCTRVEYLCDDVLLPFSAENHFARIRTLHENNADGFVGYFSPTRRRAVFCKGQEEPRGLLLFFIWYAWFNQLPGNLPDFFELFLKSINLFGEQAVTLDFDGFLEIRELLSKEYSLHQLGGVAIDMIESFDYRISDREFINTLSQPCRDKTMTNGKFLAKQRKVMDRLIHDEVRVHSTTVGLKGLLQLKIAINDTLKGLSK